MRASDAAWLGIAAGVAGYESAAVLRRWELLSEATDRYRSRHPVLTQIAIAYLAVHLLRAIPRRVDPLCRMAERARR